MTSGVTQENSFSLGAQIGGPDTPAVVLQQEQRLRNAFNRWKGNYTQAVREFAFLLRVDGSIERYTETWNIRGAQAAKRKRDWLEVEIGVPEAWWQDGGVENYMTCLAEAIESGFHSMVELLRRNKYTIDEDTLLRDWKRIKDDFLANAVKT
jgi:hypothetical protein